MPFDKSARIELFSERRLAKEIELEAEVLFVPVGPELDLYAVNRQSVLGEYIGTLNLAEAPNNLLFKLTGKHTESQGLGLDITNIICERVD